MEWDEYREWRREYLETVSPKKTSNRCQCDVEYGVCSGVVNCPYADNQGEDEDD